MTRNTSRTRTLTLVAALSVVAGAITHAHPRKVFSSLTVHEWGTFTSIAGPDGEAIEWTPLTGSTDLPSFVEHLATVHYKLGLRGTVRMETPVIYFYSPREQTVSVQAHFARGFITEWYPHATRVEPASSMWVGTVSVAPAKGSIAWDNVTLSPSLRADFLEPVRSDHYFAARQTTSTPLTVTTSHGEQHEKFLFYRGVAGFASPIRPIVGASDSVLIQNRASASVPAAILFERRGEQVDYRIVDAFEQQTEISSPELTGSVDALARDLEGILISQGLYQNEAHAMLETWRDSWFEEGSRLLYIVPRAFTDSVLPLTIKPEPQQLTRVFVGRVELITSKTREAVSDAVQAHDAATLAKYGRFLEPILLTLLKQETDPSRALALKQQLNLVYEQMASLRN